MPDRSGPPEVDRMQYNAGLLGSRGDGELCRKQRDGGLHIWIMDFILSLACQ